MSFVAGFPVSVLAFLLLPTAGCVSSGTIPVTRLSPELEAPPVHRVKSLDLAKLAQPTDSEPRIHPGDVLEVSVSDLFQPNKTETFPVRVDDHGMIRLPMLKSQVKASALTVGESEQFVRVQYVSDNVLRDPKIMVRIVKPKSVNVYVLGAVKNPGYHTLQSDNCDLLSGIMAAGGLTDDASTVVEIRRRATDVPASNPQAPAPRNPIVAASLNGSGNENGSEDLAPIATDEATTDPSEGSRTPFIKLDLSNQNDLRKASDRLFLTNGDIISIENKKYKPFYVSGSVNKPGEFEMPVDRDIRVIEAVSMAGGVFRSSNPKHVLVVRQVSEEKAVTIHIRLDKAQKDMKHNIRLMAGDTVIVEEDVASTLRGFLRDTFRVGASLPLYAL